MTVMTTEPEGPIAMDRGFPGNDTIKTALALAVRAPSVHNTQPWRWRIGPTTVQLWADPGLHLPATDPGQRDLLLSCGAALDHLRVALAALGWSARVHRLPNPAEPDHLASVELRPHRPDATDCELSAAITKRQTDRRHYSGWPIPEGHLVTMSERAAAFGVAVQHLSLGRRQRLAKAMRAAAHRHADDPGYALELALWSGRQADVSGVPADNATAPLRGDDIPARRFAGPLLVDAAHNPDAAHLLMLATTADDRVSQLRAGEAMSAVLLTAAAAGLAGCVLTEPLELDDLRAGVRREVLDDNAFPQVIIRIGWLPTSDAPLPSTPRRAVDDVLDPFDPASRR
jgi:nitroreductase